MHYRVKPYLIVRNAYQIATSPAVLDCVESILGPDILLWDGSYVIKEANSAKFVSWHQDLAYWGLAMESDNDLVSVWVAFSPATRAMAVPMPIPSGRMAHFAASMHRR